MRFSLFIFFSASIKFRVTAMFVESALKLGITTHGEICQGQWLYFSYNHDAVSDSDFAAKRRRLAVSSSAQGSLHSLASTTHGPDAVHLSVRISRIAGEVYIRPAHGAPPIKLIPPFAFLQEGDSPVVVNLCNGE